MKKRVIFGFVAVLGLTGIASVKGMHKQTVYAPCHQTIGSLAYEIQLDKNHYLLNDTIRVHAKVTNVGTEPITYHSGSSSCPLHIGVEIVNQESKLSLEGQPIIKSACTTDDNNSELAPAQTVEDDWTFYTPKKWRPSKIKNSYAGIYDVKVGLFPATSVFLSEQPERHEDAMTQLTIE
ncbi:hypothetical protein PghCCS26_63000 [Paenibacillus glycanilyticus]|uniref:Uncharacterized protein n=1 Tax=Paenibacillus glycanilyticus TaxID=126569 RepID=A0ABQ6NYH1_9BACL|nr:hypothetical protein [Paenibacillus glycanilyticus]GMK49170.1 hypothetical protein PghCCS26_63000 [Paenibacillus glycanilyticus]